MNVLKGNARQIIAKGGWLLLVIAAISSLWVMDSSRNRNIESLKGQIDGLIIERGELEGQHNGLTRQLNDAEGT